jgi:predicted nuclease with TOPRIM domain
MRRALIAALFTLLTGAVFAQGDVSARIDELQTELKSANAMRGVYQLTSLSMQEKALDNLNEQQALDKEKQDLSAKIVAYNADSNAFNAQPVCQYDHGHPEQCQSTINQQNALNQRADQLDQEQTALAQKLNALKDKIDKWKADNAAVKEGNDQNEANIKRLTIELDALRHSDNNACKQAIINGNQETMHGACGSMFDGNK